jgi:hypothetical protein
MIFPPEKLQFDLGLKYRKVSGQFAKQTDGAADWPLDIYMI